MEKRGVKRWFMPALPGLLGALLPLWTQRGDGMDPTLPWLTGFGGWLRALSLSGTGGNALAWALVLLAAALPLLLLPLRRRRGGWRASDALLPLLSGLLLALCYYLVNPTYLPDPAGRFFPMACGGAALSVLAAWGVLEVLRALENAPMEKLAAAVRVLFTVWASLQAFSACYGRMASFLSDRAAIMAANTAGYGTTIAVTGIVHLLGTVPGLLSAVALIWAAGLAGSMGERVFSQETLTLCQRTAKGCRRVAVLDLLIAVAANLLQLVLLGRLRSTRFSVVMPLLPLAIAVALYLLCRCLQQGKALQEDIDSII